MIRDMALLSVAVLLVPTIGAFAAENKGAATNRVVAEAKKAASAALRVADEARAHRLGNDETAMAQRAAAAAEKAADAAKKAADAGEQEAAEQAESAAHAAAQAAGSAAEWAARKRGTPAGKVLLAKKAAGRAGVAAAKATEALRTRFPKAVVVFIEGDLRVGMVGQLRGADLRVVQVVDGENLLGEIETAPESTSFFGRTRSGDDIKVIPATREIVWIRTPTSGMVDGQSVATNKAFKITGTKRYKTATGSRTVFLLEEEASEGKIVPPPHSEPLRKSDPRSRWVSETYPDTAFVHLEGKQWAQIDTKTRKTVLSMT